MRRSFFFALAALIAASCNWPVTSNTSSGTSGTGADAGAACPQASGCASCTQCAQAGPCAALNTACISNSDCQALDQCYGTCGVDATCRQNCQATIPNGVSDYTALTHCIDCQQCPTACGLCGT